MAQHSVAIHVSHDGARIAVWESTLRKAELISLEHVPTEPDEDRSAFWSRVREALPRDIASVIANVDAAATSTRMLSFPFTDLRKVDAALEFELEGQVPFNLDEVICTSHVADKAHGSTHVLAALAPKTTVRACVDELQAAGLEPRAAVLPAAALSELVRGETDGPAAVVSLGSAASHLAIVSRGLKYARTLRVGGNDVDRALAGHFEIDRQAARTAKETEARIIDERQFAPDRDKEISSAVVDGLTPLISSLGATFKTLPDGLVPKRLVVTGGLSRLPGLVDLLEQRLGMPVTLLDVKAKLADMASRVEAVGPEYAVVVGMALTLHRRGRGVPLNFRQGELSYEGDIQIYRGQVTRIAIGLAAVLSLAIAGSTVRYALISGEEERIDQAFCDATEKIVGRAICDPTAALATMRAVPGAAEGVVIPPYSAATLFEMVSKALDKQLDVTFDELDFRLEAQGPGQDRITGKGEAASFETTEQVVTNLKRDPCIEEATISKQRKKRNSSRVEFTLQVKVKCPSGTVPGAKLQVAEAGTHAGTSDSVDTQ